MRITLNLASRPFADLGPAIKRLRIAMAVLVVVGIGLGVGLQALHQKAEDARATEQLVQSKIDDLNRAFGIAWIGTLRRAASASLQPAAVVAPPGGA